MHGVMGYSASPSPYDHRLQTALVVTTIRTPAVSVCAEGVRIIDTRMAKKNINVAKFLGALEELKLFISSNSALLTSKGLTPANLTTAVTAQQSDVGTKNSEQENAKTVLKNKTIAVQAAADTRYPEFSSVIDLLRGAVGVGSPEAQQLRRIRQQVIGRGNSSGGGDSSGSGSGDSSSGGGSGSSS